MKAAQELYEVLTKGYPAPWRLEYNHTDFPDEVSAIVAANNETPLTLETHSGDGDLWFLRSAGAEALVKFVNSLEP